MFKITAEEKRAILRRRKVRGAYTGPKNIGKDANKLIPKLEGSGIEEFFADIKQSKVSEEYKNCAFLGLQLFEELNNCLYNLRMKKVNIYEKPVKVHFTA